MPFKSKRQRRWMYANDPKLAARWEKKTPKGKSLPEKVTPKRKVKRRKRVPTGSKGRRQ